MPLNHCRSVSCWNLFHVCFLMWGRFQSPLLLYTDLMFSTLDWRLSDMLVVRHQVCFHCTLSHLAFIDRPTFPLQPSKTFFFCYISIFSIPIIETFKTSFNFRWTAELGLICITVSFTVGYTWEETIRRFDTFKLVSHWIWNLRSLYCRIRV